VPPTDSDGTVSLASRDPSSVGAFQAIDKAIINPWFMASFFGAPVLTGPAAALHFSKARRSAWNLARTLTSTAASGCLAGAAMLYRSAK